MRWVELRTLLRETGWTIISAPLKALGWLIGFVGLILFVPVLYWVVEQAVKPPVIVEKVSMPTGLTDIAGDAVDRMIMQEFRSIQRAVADQQAPLFAVHGQETAIVLNAGEISFDVNQGLLQPLRALFGTQPTVVHTALSCVTPDCKPVERTSCPTSALRPPNAVEAEAPPPAAKPSGPHPKLPQTTHSTSADADAGRVVCVHVFADIDGRTGRRKVDAVRELDARSPVLGLSTLLRRVAEEATTAADPAAAAIYYTTQNGSEITDQNRDEIRARALEAVGLAEEAGSQPQCWSSAIRVQILADSDQPDVARAEADRLWKKADTFTCRGLARYATFDVAKRVVRFEPRGPTSDDVQTTACTTDLLAYRAEEGRLVGIAGHQSWGAWTQDYRLAAALALGDGYVRQLARKECVKDPSASCAKLAKPGAGNGKPPTAADEAAALHAARMISSWSSSGHPPPATFREARRFVRDLAKVPECAKAADALAKVLVALRPTDPWVLQVGGDAWVAKAKASKTCDKQRANLSAAVDAYRLALNAADPHQSFEMASTIARIRLAMLEPSPIPPPGMGQAALEAADAFGSALRVAQATGDAGPNNVVLRMAIAESSALVETWTIKNGVGLRQRDANRARQAELDRILSDSTVERAADFGAERLRDCVARILRDTKKARPAERLMQLEALGDSITKDETTWSCPASSS